MKASSFCILMATVFISVSSGLPIDRKTDVQLATINQEVAFPPLEGSNGENDVDVQELHSLDARSTSHPAAEESEMKRSPDGNSQAADFIINDINSNRDTPRDMAEYIFWTGDENSVTSAIKDFVDQGLMSAEDGRDFLEQVHYDLHQIQQRYGAEEADLHAEQKLHNAHKSEEEKHQGEIVVSSYRTKNNNHPNVYQDSLEDEIKSRAAADTKEELMEEMQLADLLNNEFSLEEIIYQLARILFSQSLSQAGHPEAEEALKKFADFLEKESKEGKLSPQLQKKVLDVLLMSLFDAMGDQHGPQPAKPSAPLTNATANKH